MRALFERFRKEVLALDPCVTEEFLKLYVACKAETKGPDIRRGYAADPEHDDEERRAS